MIAKLGFLAFCVFGFLALAGCVTPTVDLSGVEKAHEAARKAQMEKAELEARFMREREDALKAEHKATMERVQQMANFNHEAQELNRRNPQQNRHTFLVDLNTKLVAANSPIPASSAFIAEAHERVPHVESAPTDNAAAEFYKGKWEEAAAAAKKEEALRREKEALIVTQNEKLREKEKEVVEKYNEGMEKAKTQLENSLKALSDRTAKLYRQLIWLFGLASIASGAFAAFCFYSGNGRMGLYALVGVGLFGGGAFLTVWLQSNQWVVWVLLGGGICTIVAAFVLKQGWNVRDKQFAALAGQREAIKRYVETTLGKQLSDFGLAASETLDDLDLTELDAFRDKVVEELKKKKMSIPQMLLD